MRISLSSFLQWRVNTFVYHRLGWRIAYHYMTLLGTLYFLLNRGEKRKIRRAIESALSRRKGVSEIKSITAKVFRGILFHYYEKLFIAYEEPEKASKFLNQNVISDDLEILHAKLAKGKGVILVTGHYGAIEYIPTLLAVKNFPTSMIAKFKTKQLKRKIYSQAEKYNIRMIDAANRGNVTRSAIKELRENRVLITQCDEIEAWRPSPSRNTSFLGRPTSVDRTINVIARRTGAEVLFGIIHRYSLSKYRLIMYDYPSMLGYLSGPSTASIGETLLKILEVYIYANPEQWYQWKQYLEIRTPPRPDSPLLLQPAFENVS